MIGYVRPLDGHAVAVGWDSSLQTFYGRVTTRAEVVLAVGTGDRPITTVEDLRKAMGKWGAVIDESVAAVTFDTIAQGLELDQVRDL